MKHQPRLKLYPSILLPVLAILFAACSQRSPITNAPTPTASPALAKMEGESPNWKVTVQSVDRIEKQPVDYFGAPDVGPENKYDTLQVTLDLDYKGQAGDAPPPSAELMDAKGQKRPAAKAAIVTPTAIYMMSYGPDYSSLKTLFTGENHSTPNPKETAQTEKAMKEVLQWIDPQVASRKQRKLTGGDKLSIIYYFEDPKDYSDLALIFNDVPPIALRAPKDENKAVQPSPQPKATAEPTPMDPSMQGQSNRWKVVITSVEKVPNDTTDPDHPRDSLEVRFECEYLGSATTVEAPSAKLIDAKGAKQDGWLTSSTVGSWLFGQSGGPFKKGDKVSLAYSFKDPKDYTGLQVVFSDVPPIPVIVR